MLELNSTAIRCVCSKNFKQSPLEIQWNLNSLGTDASDPWTKICWNNSHSSVQCCSLVAQNCPQHCTDEWHLFQIILKLLTFCFLFTAKSYDALHYLRCTKMFWEHYVALWKKMKWNIRRLWKLPSVSENTFWTVCLTWNILLKTHRLKTTT